MKIEDLEIDPIQIDEEDNTIIVIKYKEGITRQCIDAILEKVPYKYKDHVLFLPEGVSISVINLDKKEEVNEQQIEREISSERDYEDYAKRCVWEPNELPGANRN